MSAGMTTAGSHEIEQKVIGCNMTTETEIAKVSLMSGTSDWTSQSILLTAGISVSSGEFIATDAPFSFDGGGSWSSQSGFSVSTNGNYEVLVKSTTGAIAKAGIQVGNIDKDAPVIGEFSCDETKGILSTTLSVSASDSISGLSESPYSYDGGGSWTSANTYDVSKNGTYQVVVRDKAGNQSSVSKTITNLYVEPPKAESKPLPATDSNSVSSKTETGTKNSEINNTGYSNLAGTDTGKTQSSGGSAKSKKTDMKTGKTNNVAEDDKELSSKEKVEAYLASLDQTTLERSSGSSPGLLKNPQAVTKNQEALENFSEEVLSEEATIAVETEVLADAGPKDIVNKLIKEPKKVMSSGFMFALLGSSGFITLVFILVLAVYLRLIKVTLWQKEEDGRFTKLARGYLKKYKEEYCVVFSQKNMNLKKSQQVMLVFHPLLQKIYPVSVVTLLWGKNKKTIGVTQKTTFCI